MKRFLLLLFLLLACLRMGIEPDLAMAHGGGALRVNNAAVGDCLVSAWSAPPTARANAPMHVTVGISAATDGSPILDADVQVMVAEQDSGAVLAQAVATTEQSVNKLFYEADIPSLPVGSYTFTATVTCHGATDSISFVLPVRPSSNPLFVAIALAVAGLLLLAFMVRRWRRQNMAGDPVRNRHPAR